MSKELIVRNLAEVVGEEVLDKITAKRPLKIYWGTAPTGNPSIGYLVPLFKIADFLEAGCEVTILFADIHAHLDSMKSTWKELEARTEWYQLLIKSALESIGVSTDKLRFVTGKEFQTKPEYALDLYKLSALTPLSESKKSGAEVVKQSDNPRLSGLLYPLLQALDEQYLDADAQFGGLDQRKIFMYAREFLPKIGYKKRIHLMSPLVPGLGKSGKMSSSEPDSKIDFTNTDKQIRKKINKAFSEDGVIEGNGLLALLKHVIFAKLDREKQEFIIDRPEEYGGKITYTQYEAVESAFASKELSSIDLKQGVGAAVIELISPVREKLEEQQELFKKAYSK